MLKSLILQVWFLLTAPFHRKLVTHRYKTVHHIDYVALKNRGVVLLIFDLDDTLTGWQTTIPKNTLQLFQKIQRVPGFSIAILSNTTRRRIRSVTKDLSDNIIILRAPSKPMVKGYLELTSQHNITPDKAAMIGDRLATDMWGAKRAGITTRILVEPYSKYVKGKMSSFVFIQKVVRHLEKFLNGHYFR